MRKLLDQLLELDDEKFIKSLTVDQIRSMPPADLRRLAYALSGSEQDIRRLLLAMADIKEGGRSCDTP